MNFRGKEKKFIDKYVYGGTVSVRLCGFLRKQSPHYLKSIVGAKKRWFNLKGVDLVYSTQPGDSKQLGSIHLPSIERILIRNDFCFVLVTPKRDWVLTATSEDRARYWICGIEQALSEINQYKRSPLRQKSPPSSPALTKTKNSDISKSLPSTKPKPPARRILMDKNRKVQFISATPTGSPSRSLATKQMVHLNKLEPHLIDLENQEMKILLKSLQAIRPFKESTVKKQRILEKQIWRLYEKKVSCEVNIAVATTVQLNMNSRRRNGNADSDSSLLLELDIPNTSLEPDTLSPKGKKSPRRVSPRGSPKESGKEARNSLTLLEMKVDV